MESGFFPHAGNHQQNNGTGQPPEPNAGKYSDRNFRPLQIKYVSRDACAECALTIVNTPGNGKRVLFSSKMIENIGSPDAIQVAIDEKGIAIGPSVPGSATTLVLRKARNKPCVYSSQFVDVISSVFSLNFSNSTSISFHEVSYLDNEGSLVAFVTLRDDRMDTEIQKVPVQPDAGTDGASGDAPTYTSSGDSSSEDEAGPAERQAHGAEYEESAPVRELEQG